MEKQYRLKHNLKVIICALVTVVLLCSTIITTVNHIYITAEEEAYENLHIETKQIKIDINHQIYSDRENLITMANFASKLYKDGEDFSLVFRSFEEIGLFEDVRILMQDNNYATKHGIITGVTDIDFNEEIKKGSYISGRVTDIVSKNKEVVRSAVPIIDDNGITIAIIYGIIDLQKFENRYADEIKNMGADLFIVDQRNGDFIIDTKRKNFGSVTELSKTNFEDGYTFDDFAQKLATGENGFVAFDSIVTGDKLYAHYAPLDFAQWQIMLAKPANEVFSAARATGSYMLFMSIVIILIMLLYILLVFFAERNNLRINSNASIIRKRLLEVNQDQSKMQEALKLITNYSNATSTFFVDQYRETYYYMLPNTKNTVSFDQKEFIINELFSYIANNRDKTGVNVKIFKLNADKRLSKEYPHIYNYFILNNIKRMDIASITNNTGNASMLCVVNSKQKYTSVLLKDIAVCFSMTIHNKKYLTKTESMALTDALTGVKNRMAYKQDVKEIFKNIGDKLTCIYIDVNELNFYNNKYGHAAGDQMLIFIADTLKKEFSYNNIYRMGGDEFLIFVLNTNLDEISEKLNRANMLIQEMKYHISIGVKKKEPQMSIEDLVNEAEKRMYLDKTKYYQRKEDNIAYINNETTVIKTEIKEVDACLEILQNKCYGIYYVSIETDEASQVLAPTYFDSLKDGASFSVILKQYIHDYVSPEYHRNLFNFAKFDLLKQQIEAGEVPKIHYTKKDGSKVLLSIWPVTREENVTDTIWLFEKE